MKINKRERIFNTPNSHAFAQTVKVINQTWKFNKSIKDIQKYKWYFIYIEWALNYRNGKFNKIRQLNQLN